MIEAGATSTVEVKLVHWEVPAPSAVVMVAPTEATCNAEGAQSEGPEPRRLESSDPMREAGAANRRKLFLRLGKRAVPPHRGWA